MSPETAEKRLGRLKSALDAHTKRYRELNGAADLADYLARPREREDEELLTEPILAGVLEQLLGFPTDGYFPQLGRSGLKPDFTPIDLVAHRFVLDAKSSTQTLPAHESQIRQYVDQRQLDYGVLFNLREVRVYRRGSKGHDTKLSFPLLPLWEQASGSALPDEEALAAFSEFCERFAYRHMDLPQKVARISAAASWSEREGRGETVEIDRDVWRNYEPKPMARIPYRHVEGVTTATKTPPLRELQAALSTGDLAAAHAATERIAPGAVVDDRTEAEAGAALEAIVRALGENRRRLLPFRELMPELTPIVKDPWRSTRPQIDVAAAVAGLPAKAVISVRLDASLDVTVETDGLLGRTRLEGARLAFTRARKPTAAVTGPVDRLRVLQQVVAGHKLLGGDLPAALLPRDLAEFESRVGRWEAEVVDLLVAGATMVELAERLVCRLYGLPPDLEQAVVDHAVSRAASASPPPE